MEPERTFLSKPDGERFRVSTQSLRQPERTAPALAAEKTRQVGEQREEESDAVQGVHEISSQLSAISSYQ